MIPKYKWKKLGNGIILIILSSCISPVDIRIDNPGGQIIISGQISTLENRSIIQIGSTAAKRLPFPETGATVTLRDEQDFVLGSYLESTAGVYRLPNFQGLHGKKYTLDVMLADGRSYKSEIEIMPEFSSSVQLEYQLTQRIVTDPEGTNVLQKFVEIYVSTTLPEACAPCFINWTVEEVYKLTPADFPDPFGSTPQSCYITQKADPNRIQLLNSSILTDKRIEKVFVCNRKVDYSFVEKHYFVMYQSFITGNAHSYWKKVNIVANQSGSIFDTPPAQIEGNIKNTTDPSEVVWGYFQSANETYNRFFLLPSDFPYPIFFPESSCRYDATRTFYPSYCFDCLSVRNSSYDRPDWF